MKGGWERWGFEGHSLRWSWLRLPTPGRSLSNTLLPPVEQLCPARWTGIPPKLWMKRNLLFLALLGPEFGYWDAIRKIGTKEIGRTSILQPWEKIVRCDSRAMGGVTSGIPHEHRIEWSSLNLWVGVNLSILLFLSDIGHSNANGNKCTIIFTCCFSTRM